jgi:hypothetical protein
MTTSSCQSLEAACRAAVKTPCPAATLCRLWFEKDGTLSRADLDRAQAILDVDADLLRANREPVEARARELVGELRGAGWSERLAPYAALYYSGAKPLSWLRANLAPAAVKEITDAR